VRVLLDANVPKKLRGLLVGHEVWTAREAGFQDLSDLMMLDAADTRFDVVVTLDRNLRHQQNLGGRSMAVAVLIAKSSRLSDLLPVVPELLRPLPLLKPGTAREIGVP
jgi:predicted nuclease of predicted toxin-antitoxin system